MNLEMLRKYDEWLKCSPGQILEAVKKVGGWTSVFPGELPRWAHRVRNYFNQEPTQLNYYQFKVEDNDTYRLAMIQIGLDVKKDLALSGHRYLDENKNIWLQMSSGGTIYHFKNSLKSNIAMAALVTTRGQEGTPIFKLFSPDRSNGSRETIIENPFTKSDPLLQKIGISIPGKGESIVKGGNLKKRVVKHPLYQGSYNYGETTVVGSAAHTKFDVTPHEKDPNGYVNPPDRFSSIFSRNFPERAEGEQKPLAEQVKY